MSDSGVDRSAEFKSQSMVPGTENNTQSNIGSPAGESSVEQAGFPAPLLARFVQELSKYPTERKQSAVIACLAAVQDEFGYVGSEHELALAAYLDMPAMAVHEVTTFYNMYNRKACGRFKLSVCTNLPCQLRGGQQALESLRQLLSLSSSEDEDQTTSDRLFTVQASECLGACADAPVMLVNDRHMCSFMTSERLSDLVTRLRQAQAIDASSSANEGNL